MGNESLKKVECANLNDILTVTNFKHYPYIEIKSSNDYIKKLKAENTILKEETHHLRSKNIYITTKIFFMIQNILRKVQA